MNSEELEQSLRAEFENYLKGVVAEMRQSVSDFQEKINADFEKHKEQLETSFREFNEQIGNERELELSFTDSVAEHLKLAKDEGARITATAIAEAEELKEEPEPPDFSDLRNAINDISEKDSQSEILKALVNHATEFTPRGAFFIVKNEHLVGWRVFGREDHEDPQVIREVFFPVDSKTALSDAVRQLSTVSETGYESEDDVMYRNKLGFENPEEMCAIPLIARGRGVAVLYADTGSTGGHVNVSAIESLMRVAGLTVEVLASAPPISREQEVEDTAPAAEVAHEDVREETEDYGAVPAEFESADEYNTVSEVDAHKATPFAAPLEESEEYQEEIGATEFESSEDVADEGFTETEEYQFQPIESPVEEYEAPSVEEETEEYSDSTTEFGSPVSEFADMDQDPVVSGHPTATFEAEEWAQPETPSAEVSDDFESGFDESADEASEFDSYDAGVHEPYAKPAEEESASDYEFESPEEDSSIGEAEDGARDFEFGTDTESTSFDDAEASELDSAISFEEPVDSAPDEVSSFDSFEEVTEDVSGAEPQQVPVEAKAPPVRPRFADRNLDLPIEVGEDERRLHNDARRFARLLVSEIKLYNEQKVKEGRESNDLYERLREAIDRSREMYDKRVQPPVAAKFDYFNYELVNTLAEGDEGKLGGSYPGPAI